MGVNAISNDLGIKAAPQVDPVANFPYYGPKHRSLMVKAFKEHPEFYAKYCNKKTPMGFTFDSAIQAGLDAPHLGVGIIAGEAAAFETYKDIMDFVIEGWHGYKPTDKHSSNMDYNQIVMTDAQVKKFDRAVVSTRIRAGRSIETMALPPATDRRQRRLVEKLLTEALTKMPADLEGILYINIYL